jgi:tetratricopeptide (TPR) repeat protein
MDYVGEDKARLRRKLTTEAIALAMEGRWEEAVNANREILAAYPTDVDACNRLGRGLMELGQYKEAKESYRRALELEPSNGIAKKNLERLSHLKETPVSKERHKVAPHLFVEEIGRAGVVKLIQLAPKEILAHMVAGDAVNLKVNGQILVVASPGGEYLGQVDPKHSNRLIRLMTGGNMYEAAITTLDEDGVKVIIREIFQHPSQVGKLSFPVKDAGSIRPYVKGSMLKHELEESSEGGEEEEATLEESGYSLEWEGGTIAEDLPIDETAVEEGSEVQDDM